MNKSQMEQQVKIAKEGIEVLDKWAETLDAEVLDKRKEEIEKAKNYCKDCLEASQIIVEAIAAGLKTNRLNHLLQRFSR